MTRLIRAFVAATVLSFVLAGAALAGQHTCADYPSQAAAQAVIASQPQLDRDRDGIACEGNRAPFASGATAGSQEGAAPATTGGGTAPSMPRTGAGGMAEESPAGPIAAVAGATLLAGVGLVALRRRRATT